MWDAKGQRNRTSEVDGEQTKMVSGLGYYGCMDVVEGDVEAL